MERTLHVPAPDGFRLAATIFGDGTERPFVIVNSAMGVPQRYYRRFATWLAGRGHRVLTWDYRGMGASRPRSLRGFEARLRDWGELDLEGILEFSASEAKGRALTVVGHSIGGQLLGFPRSNALLTRAVTVSASSVASWLYPPRTRLAFSLVWHLMPLLARPLGFLPGQLGTGGDIPLGIARDWAAWGRSPNAFLDHGVSREGFARLVVPLRSFSFTDDSYAPKDTVDWLHSLFSGAAVERRHLDPARLGLDAVGHFGFFRPVASKFLWEDVAAFLE